MDFHISLSGLEAAQRAIELVGTNISNAATEGYHRQRLTLSAEPYINNTRANTGGVRIEGSARAYDLLLEREMLRQRPSLGDAFQQLAGLQSIENVLGDMDGGGLANALDAFYGSLRELAAQPESGPFRQQVLQAADNLGVQFRNLADFLDGLEQSVYRQAQASLATANGLADEIARLNGEIQRVSLTGGSTGLLEDRRDQAVTELSDLVDVQVQTREDGRGIVDVSAWGTPMVLGTRSGHLEVARTVGQELGITVEGADQYQTSLSGGKVGGLLTLRNTLIADAQNRLDVLAGEVVRGINRLHVQGVGTGGAFAARTGWAMPTGTLDTWDAGVVDGTLRVRLTAPDGTVTAHSVSIDADTDTLATVVAKLNALDAAHLEASLVDGALRVAGKAGYTFDFRPAPVVDAGGLSAWHPAPVVDAGGLSAGDAPAVAASGIFTGSSNDTYTLTVVHPDGAGNAGQVGMTEGLELRVTNGAGQTVRTLTVGQGYAAGDSLTIDKGVDITLGAGTLNHGEAITVVALADADTSGLLAAAGINAFLSGTQARDFSVRDAVVADPSLLAVSRGAAGIDNGNVLRMADLGDQAATALDGLTPQDYHRQIVIGIGQHVKVQKSRTEALEQVLHQLANQRDATSGVDLNEEAAKLLVFERMYQAVARVLATQTNAMEHLMNVI